MSSTPPLNAPVISISSSSIIHTFTHNSTVKVLKAGSDFQFMFLRQAENLECW